MAIVVTHNRPEYLRRVISALYTQTVVPNRVIVIDNASETPAKEVLKNFSSVEVFRLQRNQGGAGGFAYGLDLALKQEADWIWLMDDDAIPRMDALEKLIEAIDILPKSAGALCSSVLEFGSIALMHRRFYSKKLGLEKPIAEIQYGRGHTEIDTGSFVGFLLNSRACRNVGLPDSRFFLAYDDTEYSLRLKKHGWKIWLIPDSVIVHLRSSASRFRDSCFSSKHYYNIRNRLFVASQYTQCSTLAVILAILTSIAIWLASREFWQPNAIKLFVRAIVDGLRGELGEKK